jgi:hypothetical protein
MGNNAIVHESPFKQVIIPAKECYNMHTHHKKRGVNECRDFYVKKGGGALQVY